ncbi:uncharacterized protein [Choristoneura fumiferana]|uniref:uncharacterized protein n=1 Tax=Choristoneura fumiferana TaxID=7141 RepID=UPI003D15766E
MFVCLCAVLAKHELHDGHALFEINVQEYLVYTCPGPGAEDSSKTPGNNSGDNAYLVELANRSPNIIRVVSGGRSVEGCDIKYLKISTTDFQINILKEILSFYHTHFRGSS